TLSLPPGIARWFRALWQPLLPKSAERETQGWPGLSVPLAEILRPGEERGQIALKTEALTWRFGGLTAVDDVWLEVRSGRVHALIGPNGAGKSSLLNLISGFYVPTDGRITFF